MPLNLKTKVVGGGSAVILAVGLLAGSGIGDSGLEGLVNGGAPYRDIAGIWTDCYGNTKDVNPNRVRSIEECKRLVNGEAARIEKVLLRHLKTPPPPLTMASFISAAYNIGDKAFLNSSMLKRWNRGNKIGACEALFLWDKVTMRGVKVFSQGIYNRRVVEHAACIEGLQNAA